MSFSTPAEIRACPAADVAPSGRALLEFGDKVFSRCPLCAKQIDCSLRAESQPTVRSALLIAGG